MSWTILVLLFQRSGIIRGRFLFCGIWIVFLMWRMHRRPPILSSPTVPTPVISYPTTWSLRPGHRWSRWGGGFRWPPTFPCPGIIPMLWSRSMGLLTRCSWLVPANITLMARIPGDPWSVQVCYHKCPLPSRHQHIMDKWRQGVRPGAFRWEGVPLWHILSCPVGSLGSYPPCHAIIGLTSPNIDFFRYQ